MTLPSILYPPWLEFNPTVQRRVLYALYKGGSGHILSCQIINISIVLHFPMPKRTCFALNWPKLAWCKDRWNVYTMCAVQLICTNFLLFLCFYLYDVHMRKCTFDIFDNLFYRYRPFHKTSKVRFYETDSISIKELTNVEIKEQTAFWKKFNFLPLRIHQFAICSLNIRLNFMYLHLHTYLIFPTLFPTCFGCRGLTNREIRIPLI